MSSPYEGDTFTEVSDSDTQASQEGADRKAADLDHDKSDQSHSRTHSSADSPERWSEGVSRSSDSTSSTSEEDRRPQVYSVSSIGGESPSRSSLGSSGRIVQKWSHSSTSAATTLSGDISTELPEDSAVDRDASYSEDFTTTSATSVTEEDVRSDRSSGESVSVKEELEDETVPHHGDSYHGYSSDDFESAGGQSSATESVSAVEESEALSNFLLRACEVVKQNSSATVDNEVLASSSTLQVVGKTEQEDIRVTPELLDFCSRKLQLLRDRPGPGAEGRSKGRHGQDRKEETREPTMSKIPTSDELASRNDRQTGRQMREREGTVEEGKIKSKKQPTRKQKLHERKGSNVPSICKAVVEIAPPQEGIDLVGETHKESRTDLMDRTNRRDGDGTEAQGTESSVPQGLIDRLRLKNMMLDMRKGAKAKVHNPRTCKSCVKRQGALLQEEFLKTSRAVVERKMIDAKVEEHLMTHDSLTLIGEIARTLPRPTDDPQNVWARLMKGTVGKKPEEEN